jgi:hypothetical protein
MRYILIPLFVLFAMPHAHAATLTASEVRACNAMAAGFGPKRAEFERLSSRRDALVISVEDAGDTWEAAEALRNFSPDHAQQADTTKAAYDDLVAEFDAVEQAYRVTGTQLNDDFAAYNAKCATED